MDKTDNDAEKIAKAKKSKIVKERKRISKIFGEMPDKQRDFVEKLIDEAAFMAVTLAETREIINSEGIIETYKNGENQYGKKKSAAFEVYDKLVNTYSKVIAQLTGLLPPEAKVDAVEELNKFREEWKP